MEKEAEILIVDDEWNMRNLMKLYLSRQGWHITEATSGNEAIEKFHQQTFDLIVLDIMMPGIDGWDVCTYIREQKSEIPILLLTARNETQDKVYGLNLGADDYLTKPFEVEELVARIRALLRRTQSQASAEKSEMPIHTGDISIHPESRQVFIKNKNEVSLSPKEYEVLYLLAKNPHKAFARDELIEKIWGMDFDGDYRTVDQQVKNLREKLKKRGLSINPIKTLWGFGYQMQMDSHES